MMNVTADTEKTLIQLAEAFITAIYEGALTKLDFSAVTSDFTVEESSRTTMEQAYNTFVSNHINSSSHLTQVDFTGFSSSAASSYAEDGCYAIQITSDVDYTADSVVVPLSSTTEGQATASQNKHTSGNSLFTTAFHYKDGIWSIHATTALDACVYYIKY